MLCNFIHLGQNTLWRPHPIPQNLPITVCYYLPFLHQKPYTSPFHVPHNHIKIFLNSLQSLEWVKNHCHMIHDFMIQWFLDTAETTHPDSAHSAIKNWIIIGCCMSFCQSEWFQLLQTIECLSNNPPSSPLHSSYSIPISMQLITNSWFFSYNIYYNHCHCLHFVVLPKNQDKGQIIPFHHNKSNPFFALSWQLYASINRPSVYRSKKLTLCSMHLPLNILFISQNPWWHLCFANLLKLFSIRTAWIQTSWSGPQIPSKSQQQTSPIGKVLLTLSSKHDFDGEAPISSCN